MHTATPCTVEPRVAGYQEDGLEVQGQRAGREWQGATSLTTSEVLVILTGFQAF